MSKGHRNRTTLRPLGYLTPKEAAGYFGCTAEGIKTWLYNGKLKGTKAPNGYWYIKESDVARELEARGLPVPNLSKRGKRKYSMKPVEINWEAAKQFGFNVGRARGKR